MVAKPSRRAVRATRATISPRLAISTEVKPVMALFRRAGPTA